jgi:hypothetical protein
MPEGHLEALSQGFFGEPMVLGPPVGDFFRT